MYRKCVRLERTILIVDDEEFVRRTTCRILSRAGHQLLEASSSEEALELLAGQPVPVDLLLTDLTMPGIDGLELVRRLRSDQPALRVLFMSGYPEEGRLDQLEDVEFIRKPFTPNELKTKISSMLKAGLSSR